jgi:hypothetical protein
MPSSSKDTDGIADWQEALERIDAPISEEEAEGLIALLPVTCDDSFGLAWTLIHLIETAPNWPLETCLKDMRNPWVLLLRQRASI